MAPSMATAYVRYASGARRCDALDRQLLGHDRRRPLLGVRQLRMRVQPVAQLDGAGNLALDAGEQPPEQRVNRSRHTAGTVR